MRKLHEFKNIYRLFGLHDKDTGLLHLSFTNVVEFRDASWCNENVFLQPTKKNIVFSGASFPKLPDQVINTTPAL